MESWFGIWKSICKTNNNYRNQGKEHTVISINEKSIAFEFSNFIEDSPHLRTQSNGVSLVFLLLGVSGIKDCYGL
jgi:hypothetical protein